jgi:hypothetical protein
MTITVLYSCVSCGLNKIPLDVPARDSPAVDVVLWMQSTVERVADDHRRRSPSCDAKKLSDLLIPITGTDRIGGPAVQ